MADVNNTSTEEENKYDLPVRNYTKKIIFKWTPKMIEELIASIEMYKSSMEFKNIDFDADKSAQYEFVR